MKKLIASFVLLGAIGSGVAEAQEVRSKEQQLEAEMQPAKPGDFIQIYVATGVFVRGPGYHFQISSDPYQVVTSYCAQSTVQVSRERGDSIFCFIRPR